MRPRAPSRAKTTARMIEQTAMKRVIQTPPTMNDQLSRIHVVSNLVSQKRTIRIAKIAPQTIASLIQKGTRREASSRLRRLRPPWEGNGAEDPAPGPASCVLNSRLLSALDLRGEVLAVPLHRQIGERAVLVHLIHDLAHLLNKARRVLGRPLVERNGERLLEDARPPPPPGAGAPP